MVHQTRSPSSGGVGAYSLSAMQQGMLYHALEGRPGVDLQQVIGELDAEIVPAAFAEAWRQVVARHPVLRTRFVDVTGPEPRQEVCAADSVDVPLQVLDVPARAGSERLRVEAYLEQDRRNAFVLEEAPLLRVALLPTARRSWFVVTYHHLILDARSMALMFREVLDRHDAIVAGGSLPVEEGVPYRDFVAWWTARETAGAEAFWRGYLQGFTTPTALPGRTGSEHTGGDDGACGELMFRLSAALTERLRTQARDSGVTLNTLVQAAWAIVLGRYAGEDEVVFGALRAGRHAPVAGLETMLGLCINTVAVRARVAPADSVTELLQRLRADWVAFRPHEHTPLAHVQGWSEVEPGRPLFQTLLNVQDPAWDEALRALGGKWARRRFDIRSRPHYPLAIDVYAGTELTTKCFFEREAYPPETAAQVLGHFRHVLEALAEDVSRPLREVALLTPREERQILETWNDTAASYPANECVHTLVEAHADEHPEWLAVSDPSTSLTYGQLNRQANQLAHQLVRRGVRRGTPVAVCLERSAEMLVAWLAVLKAGGAFVPLDPQYPRERLAFLLQDCQSPLVLVRDAAAFASGFGSVAALEVSVSTAPDETSERSPGGCVKPDDLAYIIYTSGSTGQPKGVQIEHRSLMNLVAWHQRTYGLTPADRAPQLASPAFDASVWETWPYLATGASVHIPDDETRVAPALLWRWLAERRITVAFVPTPLAEALLREPWPTGLALRAILTGGDRLRIRPPAEFPCALVNHYGPTESTVVATCGRVADSGSAAPVIGRPIANTAVFVLDRSLCPVPAGAAGEAFIAGDGLARGYWNRPELDAEKFVTLHVGLGGTSLRAYRTGDLVRWTPAGDLEFIGRIDGQVKVRGCRIELGEIEAHLQACADVREALVVTRPDLRDQLQLVAYVRPSQRAMDLDTSDPAWQRSVFDHLRARLPAYMVPAAVVVVREWPLTPNGKVDRRALPAPEWHLPAAAGARPATAAEQLVARAWAEVLRHDDLEGQANFFELGGHSLLAAQVVARLNAQLSTPVSVRMLFDHPTLAAFAREVETRMNATDVMPRRPTQRLKRRAPRPDLAMAEPQ